MALKRPSRDQKNTVICGADYGQILSAASIICRDRNGGIQGEHSLSDTGKWTIPSEHSEHQISISCPGYIEKHYKYSEIPSVVRLLHQSPIAYFERLSFPSGSKANVYSSSSEEFEATIFRYGADRELVRCFGKQPPFEQRIPDGRFCAEGLSWQPTLSIDLQGLPSGLYGLRLRCDSHSDFYAPFIIGPHPSNHQTLLVVSSTNTWTMYNCWGGRSRYRSYEDFSRNADQISRDFIPRRLSFRKRFIRKFRSIAGLPDLPESWERLPLSWKKPFPWSGLDQEHPEELFTNHFAGSEWRILSWLEKNGFQYDLISDADFHNYSEIPSHYHGVLILTHSEYWSRRMASNLVSANQQKGIWIFFLGGNSIASEVEFCSDHQISLFQDHPPTVPDLEKTLLVRTNLKNVGTCASYRVISPDHWSFLGIRPDDLVEFGRVSLNQDTPLGIKMYDPSRPGSQARFDGSGASGWEVDCLVQEMVTKVTHLAKGLNLGGGADVYFKEPSGKAGGIFGTSSITFGGSLLVDQVSSIMLRNIIERCLKLKPFP